MNNLLADAGMLSYEPMNLEKRNYDSLAMKSHKVSIDSIRNSRETKEIELNDNAVRLIQFDFVPSHTPQNIDLKPTPLNKPWMDFQVDLAVPKSLIDTTKARKPEKYIRMLPYSIWSLFGRDPVYDILVFGNKKRLEIMWNLNLDKIEEYGKNLIPNAGGYDPNPSVGAASVVIGDLDFIGFLYDNLNKQGRIRKHNRKHANAWKTYNKVAPTLSTDWLATDSLSDFGNSYAEGQPGLYHHLKTIELTEERRPKYSEHPDHELLQTPEQRSRFGTFYDPELYAMPSTDQHQTTDSLKMIHHESKMATVDSLEFESSPTEPTNRKKGKSRQRKRQKKSKETNEGPLEELPNDMEDLYKYIRRKQQQDSIQRQDRFRKDKVENNVYELEQQQRKLRERQN